MYYADRICTNCDATIPPSNHACTDKTGLFHFCDQCAGYIDALAIGDPATKDLFLYEFGNRAINWTGAILGTIERRTVPARPRGQATYAGVCQPIRYRVRMLDGSLWYGTGPLTNGNCLRLHRMKTL